MPDNISPKSLMEAHVAVQMGTYFTDVQSIGHGLQFASSSRISDYFWNYAFGLACAPSELPDRLASVRAYAEEVNRKPTIYSTPETQPQKLEDFLALEESVAEVWMTLERGRLERPVLPTGLQISPVTTSEELDQFIHVFRDAYGSGDPSSPGYSGLPEEYPESIRKAKPAPEVEVTNFLGKEDDIPVSCSSIFCKAPYAGLYSVGTTHEARRKHYGSIMSLIAVEHALNQGCQIIFLQTEADSPVEELYRKLGFRREFIGQFLVLA